MSLSLLFQEVPTMKLIAKVSGLGVIALGAAIGLAGCAESNDVTATKTPTGKSAPGVVPPGTPRSSADAAEAQKANNPMMSKDYPK